MTGNYGYDAIGEMTKDSTNGISNVSWTVYGKIQQITKSDGSTLVFTYDPAGNRISKIYTASGASPVTTWYVRDAQGNILSIYTSGDVTVNGGDLSLTESDIYGSSRLGMLRTAIDVYNPMPVTPVILPLLGQGYGVIFARGDKLFELTNRLGNVLATISDKKYGVSLDGSTVDHYVPQVVSASDYYPFGSQMPGRDTTLGGKYYRYGFNGKENDNEVKGVGDQQDYGARIYDPRVGRWLTRDPSQSTHASLTPYHFATDNPINLIDANGEDTIRFTEATTTYLIPSPVDGLGARLTGSTKTSVSILQAPGKDVFYYDVIKKAVDATGKVTTIAQTSTQFYPYDDQESIGFSGITQSPSTNIPFANANDPDDITLAKLAPPALVTYLKKHNANRYGGLTMDQVGLKLSQAVSAFSGVVTVAFDFGGGEAGIIDVASSGGGSSAPMQLVRTIQKGEKIDDIVTELMAATWTTGNEHAVVTLGNGERAIVSGGPGGITFKPGEIENIFGHTHPTSAPPSSADQTALSRLGQSRQYVLHGGNVSVVRPK